MPDAAASSGARPKKYLRGEQPKMDMMAVSLPGAKPSGTLRTLPRMPWRARASIASFFDASSGVRPPSVSSGWSAMPSPMTRMYFIPYPSFRKIFRRGVPCGMPGPAVFLPHSIYYFPRFVKRCGGFRGILLLFVEFNKIISIIKLGIGNFSSS